MGGTFDYDVFLSFSASDEGLVRPVWQELCLSGLRVFWSDATLKRVPSVDLRDSTWP